MALFTPPAGRAGLIRRCLEAGKDVMATKPFELDPSAAEAVRAEACAHGRVVASNSPAPGPAPDLACLLAWRDRFDLGRPVALRASGVACAQLCPYFDVVHGVSGIEMGRWMMAAMLDAIARLGCHRLRVFTSPPWGACTVGPQQAAAALAEYADLAGPSVELCLECHAGSLMEDAPSALRSRVRTSP